VKVAWLLVVLLACNDSAPARQENRGPGHNIVDDEVKRALVLDAAMSKLEKEIATLESSPSPDPVELAQKKEQLEAVRSTLAETRRHIEQVRGSAN
jgi:hypothetical protein